LAGPTVVNKLGTMRGPGESYSDVILRLIEVEVSIRR
jgi:predicted CopG family antitoxin